MSKRKKLRTSGGEGVQPPKPPKSPRLGDFERPPHSSELGFLCHPEEAEGGSGPAPCADQSGEEPGQAASSSPDKEAGAPSRLLGQPKKEPVPFLPSQNSVRRFVPQFAKPRKTVTRPAETREEDLGGGASSSETVPEPSAQDRSQLQEESPGLAFGEARELGAWTQADITDTKHSSQNPKTPLPVWEDPQPSIHVSLECGIVALASEWHSQDHLSEQGTNSPNGGHLEQGGVSGDHRQKGHLLSNDAEEKGPDQGAPKEEGAQGGTEGDLPTGHLEEADSILGLVTQGPEPGSAAQDPPDPMQKPNRTVRDAEQSCSSPRCSSLGIMVIADISTDPIQSGQRAPEVGRPDGQASTRAPASPGGKAPNGSHSRALLSSMPLAVETAGGRGEGEWENRPPGNIPEVPAASPALDHRVQESTIGDEDSSPLASEMGPGVAPKEVPGWAQEGLEGVCVLSLPPHCTTAAQLGSQCPEQDLEELSLSIRASAPLVHREAVDAPCKETGDCQGSSDTPTDPACWPRHPPDSANQATSRESPAMELDLLPDSQIQDALEAPDFGASPEQESWLQCSQSGARGRETTPAGFSLPHAGLARLGLHMCSLQLFPAGSEMDPCWPGTSPHADGGPLTEAPLRTHVGIEACEAVRMEDATDTVRGLIIELSNLNRLIMSTHRDLEALKRLSYRKVKPAGKAQAPYT
ncbi:break repair meiotic recombinase recruitment factor 1 isoform X2 [Manis pentadactyla]|uniref:break repair meiotic recombinase recruitment factor 1 isoform X2 n=1 Tax=Manis pentadactyla TaxID=143292 RepID=UPI00255C81E1|nr:break repair meiotic recombinase recruitment factor 1 isoform X2 [Manis pentadactyla]